MKRKECYWRLKQSLREGDHSFNHGFAEALGNGLVAMHRDKETAIGLSSYDTPTVLAEDEIEIRYKHSGKSANEVAERRP